MAFEPFCGLRESWSGLEWACDVVIGIPPLWLRTMLGH